MIGLALAATLAFNPGSFGAKGDGVSLDSGAINQAIAACHAAGGGTVRLEPGVYRCGTLRLLSSVELQLAEGAIVAGSRDLGDYQTLVEPQGRNQVLIEAQDADEVSITGAGTIDGGTVFNPAGEEHMRGPHALGFYRCEKVRIEGVRIRHASNWAVMLWSCRGFLISGIDIQGGWDGVNLHDAVDGTITGCRFQTGDDCLAGSYWENVRVSNSVLNSSANAIRVAGRHVLFSNLLIYGPGEYAAGSSLRHKLEAGFQILPNRANAKNRYAAKGPADDIVLRNVTMLHVGTAAWIDASTESAYNTDNLGIGRIVFDHVRVVDAGKTPFYLAASASRPAGELVLDHVDLGVVGGTDAKESAGQGNSPFSVLEAYAVLCRNVGRVELHDVAVTTDEPEGRIPFAQDRVGEFVVDHVTVNGKLVTPGSVPNVSPRSEPERIPRLQPIVPPWRQFANTTITAGRIGHGFYLKGGGDRPVLQQGDQYAALYLPQALPPDGAITVRMSNPDRATSWRGRAGLIVRNAIDQPGRPGGYLTVGSSPAAGSYVEWNSAPEGRLDRHTEFDGYTPWPHWLRLVRHGPRFFGYRSRDGVNWDLLGEAEVSGAGGHMDAGIFAFADSARFDDFRIAAR